MIISRWSCVTIIRVYFKAHRSAAGLTVIDPADLAEITKPTETIATILVKYKNSSSPANLQEIRARLLPATATITTTTQSAITTMALGLVVRQRLCPIMGKVWPAAHLQVSLKPFAMPPAMVLKLLI